MYKENTLIIDDCEDRESSVTMNNIGQNEEGTQEYRESDTVVEIERASN